MHASFFLYRFCPKHFCIDKQFVTLEMGAYMHVGLQESICYFCLILTISRIYLQILTKLSNIRCYENLFSGSRVAVTCSNDTVLTGPFFVVSRAQ
jgi:hypothetical protein